MDIYGVISQDALGRLNLASPSMTGLFFNSSGVYNSSASIPNAGFPTQFAISTPLQPGSIGFPAGQWIGFGGVRTSIAGYPNASGTQYSAPTSTEVGLNALEVIPPALTPLTSYVYTFGVPGPATGYGFRATGQFSNDVAIDAEHKAFYVQTLPDGTAVRTGTATSLDSSFNNPFNAVTQQTPTGGQTIFFDKAYNNPPLIFVTSSAGPIALNYMVRDGNGKFIGMHVVASSSLVTRGQWPALGFYQPNTYTFNYFLVSDEVPVYGNPSNYGTRVFNSRGEKVYDSAFFTPTFVAIYASTPFARLTGSWPTFTGGQYRTDGRGVGIVEYTSVYDGVQNSALSITKSPQIGLCLNNLNAFTGWGCYTKFVGDGFVPTGPMNMFGRFMHVQSDTQAYVIGTGACAFDLGIYFNAPGWANCWDFHFGSSPTLSILGCSYYF